ncbi:MAG: hypothetical protein JSW29_05810 [Candidatus Bathyarchaeota archaeon]|nr:MAG: hypothetical protein JSW29_05810 [Candidatus Bathyarchaeota archaeon]
MRKRTKIEIMADILSICRRPQNKTRLLYEANLSWSMLNRYLDQMRSLRLLEIHRSPIRYQATPKGGKFVEIWEEIGKILTFSHSC